MTSSFGSWRWQPAKRRLVACVAYGALMLAAWFSLQDRRLLISTLAVLVWLCWLTLRTTPPPAPAPGRRAADLEPDRGRENWEEEEDQASGSAR